MATITTSLRSRNLAEANQRVRGPLDRLRSSIRLYVGLEGALVVGLYLALWFWIGLLLDYGVFRLFHFDWVQETPWGVRCGVLIVLLSGLLAAVATKVAARLFREFRDSALALVLERRFPAILGDRLITAVELADPKKAAEIGYSQAMVQETIHEAAQRVEQLKIKEVFHWERLVRRGVLVGILIIGGYLLAGLSFCTANAIRGYGFAGFSQFHDVAGIWFERNILLRNLIWPRMAHLQLLDVPPAGEWRMGRGDKPPTIRVRAFKYVIAGAPRPSAVHDYRMWLGSLGIANEQAEELARQFAQKPEEGWRPLTWFDLTPDLLGGNREDVPISITAPDFEGWILPQEWKVFDLRNGMTLDEIELNLEKPETHQTLTADAQQQIRKALELLEIRAADPAMNRVLRKLTIPDEVVLLYKGNTTSSQTNMQKLADNEYTGQFGELKETVDFTVQGLDYYTATRRVVVVEPPVLEVMTRTEERPAYLYYRVSPDDSEVLRGKKQLFTEAQVSLQGGEVSKIDLPAGTNLTLTATASKELQKVELTPHKSHKSGIPLIGSKPEMIDPRTFRINFPNVRFEQIFLIRFTDTDGVTGQRQVVILPSEDAPPKVQELAPDEIIRKVQGGYMATVNARIPFKGQVNDDHGLTEVRYAYTISHLEATRIKPRDAWPVLGGTSLAPAGQGPLPGLLDLAVTIKSATQEERKSDDASKKRYVLPSFKKALGDRIEDTVFHLDTIREELAKKQREPYRTLLSKFTIKADEWTQPELDPLGCDLPLWKTDPNLKMTDPSRPQPRYQMEIQLEAIDTDLDSDQTKDGKPRPHLKVSDEKFTIFLVSENELLTEIAKEEEKLYGDLDGMYQKLMENQAKLVQVNLDLSSASLKPSELGNPSARTDQVSEVLEKSQNVAREVYTAYARILKEMKTNQVNQKFITQVDKNIVDPLDKVDGTFDKARDGIAAFRKALDSKDIPESRKAGATAKEQLAALTLAIEKILASMQKMTSINDLIAKIAAIEKSEREQYEEIEKINKQKLEELLKDTIAPEGEKPVKKK